MDIDRALTDPGFFVANDPHPLWQQLRREDPVHWTEGLVRPFWSVTRYDDIVEVFSEPNLFTSTRGLFVPSSPEMEQLTPEMMGAGQTMIMTDPPLHGAMRRAFNRLFLPRPIGRYESPGEALVREILEGVLERGQCDFVVDLAARREKEFNLYTSPEKSDQKKLQKAVGWIKDPAKAIKPLTDVIDQIEDDQQSKQMLRTIIDDELATIKWLQETLALLSVSTAA